MKRHQRLPVRMKPSITCDGSVPLDGGSATTTIPSLIDMNCGSCECCLVPKGRPIGWSERTAFRHTPPTCQPGRLGKLTQVLFVEMCEGGLRTVQLMEFENGRPLMNVFDLLGSKTVPGCSDENNRCLRQKYLTLGREATPFGSITCEGIFVTWVTTVTLPLPQRLRAGGRTGDRWTLSPSALTSVFLSGIFVCSPPDPPSPEDLQSADVT